MDLINNLSMGPRELYTIGYEGREIEEFVACLKSHKIGRLIDVREIPISRKKGFSKSALKIRFESEHIEYVHLRSLGSPSTIRHKLKSDQDYDYFFKAYLEYLSQNHNAVVEAYRYIQDGLNCLMCFERNPVKCHRTAAAQKIIEYAGNGLKIFHI